MSHYVALSDDASIDPSDIPSVPSAPSPAPSLPHPHTLFRRLFDWERRSYCNRCIVVCYLTFTYTLSALLLYIALTYKGADGAQQLCLWLMISSALLFTCTTICLILIICLLTRSCGNRSPAIIPLLLCSLFLQFLFCFVWFVIGNVWFFLTPSGSCPTIVLRTVFWTIMYAYFSLVLHPAISVITSCVRKGCPCVKRSATGREHEEQTRRQVLQEIYQEQLPFFEAAGALQAAAAAAGGGGGQQQRQQQQQQPAQPAFI